MRPIFVLFVPWMATGLVMPHHRVHSGRSATVRAATGVVEPLEKRKRWLPKLAALGTLATPLIARAADATPHLGEKVAMALQSSGVPDALIIAAIAGMPVVELRGAIPVGIWMGVPMIKVFALCVLGNMAPIIPLLVALRAPFVQKLLDKPLKKARDKSDQVLGNNRWAALAAFVGVPFPGTGAWTGGMIAFVLGMPLAEALSSIFAGVVAAGLIVTALVAAGKVGAVLAALGLCTILLLSRQQSGKNDD